MRLYGFTWADTLEIPIGEMKQLLALASPETAGPMIG